MGSYEQFIGHGTFPSNGQGARNELKMKDFFQRLFRAFNHPQFPAALATAVLAFLRPLKQKSGSLSSIASADVEKKKEKEKQQIKKGGNIKRCFVPSCYEIAFFFFS